MDSSGTQNEDTDEIKCLPSPVCMYKRTLSGNVRAMPHTGVDIRYVT